MRLKIKIKNSGTRLNNTILKKFTQIFFYILKNNKYRMKDVFHYTKLNIFVDR